MSAPAIYIKNNFVTDTEALFLHLKENVAWDVSMRARKTASFGIPYDYSQISYAAIAMPEQLQIICQAIETELGFMPNNCLLNFYLDGSSSMGFHSDSSKELVAGTGVAIISLGSLRHITYRNKKDKNLEFTYPLPVGTLLYMSDEIQQEWLHAIHKEPGSGERISLTFRQIANI